MKSRFLYPFVPLWCGWQWKDREQEEGKIIYSISGISLILKKTFGKNIFNDLPSSLETGVCALETASLRKKKGPSS